MAGTYPDVPGYRFAYDQDGTTAVQYFLWDSSNAFISASLLRSLNNDSPSLSGVNTRATQHCAFLFPEPRDISGILLNLNSNTSGTLDWSNDTTNGYDGTWQTIDALNNIRIISTLKTSLRTDIQLRTISGITALRLSNWGIGDSNINHWYNFHLYGSVAPTESPDRLRIVDMSGNDIAAQLDFGDIRQRNNSTKQFKVVNNSDTLTANNITITLDAPTNASPSLIGQYQLSTDNTAFANAINIGNLAPGASSGTLYVRNTVAATAQLSVWSLRIIASANTWS